MDDKKEPKSQLMNFYQFAQFVNVLEFTVFLRSVDTVTVALTKGDSFKIKLTNVNFKLFIALTFIYTRL